MKNITEIKDYSTVRKAEEIINARYAMSTTAIKIVTTIISQIDKKDTDLHMYTINVKDMAKTLEMKDNGKNYQQFKAACEELATRSLTFENENGWQVTTWLASAEYKKDQGTIELEISKMLRPLLVQLKERGKYLNYELKNVLGLKSSYLIRLYEKLKHEYNKDKYHKTTEYEITIDELREQFNIPKSYQFRDIRERIIDKAVEEFKLKTDLEISWEATKVGRRVDKIKFIIEENEKLKLGTLQEFVRQVREKYKGKVVIENEEEHLGLDKDGYLYNVNDHKKRRLTTRQAEAAYLRAYKRQIEKNKQAEIDANKIIEKLKSKEK